MTHVTCRSTHFLAGLCLLAAFASAGCEDPAKQKSKAEVAAPVQASAAEQPAGKLLAFGPADSKIEFVGSKVTGHHDGSFGQFLGTIHLVDGDVTKSRVSVDIDASSISADVPKLTGHLKSADFFDVEKFAKVHFESTAIKPGGDKGASHTVTGNLEMHGMKKSISFPATIKLDGDRVNVDAEFAVNRKDFGLNYPGKADDLIRDDVVVKLSVRAAPKTS